MPTCTTHSSPLVYSHPHCAHIFLGLRAFLHLSIYRYSSKNREVYIHTHISVRALLSQGEREREGKRVLYANLLCNVQVAVYYIIGMATYMYTVQVWIQNSVHNIAGSLSRDDLGLHVLFHTDFFYHCREDFPVQNYMARCNSNYILI